MGKIYCIDVGKIKREVSKLIFKLGSLGKWKINSSRKYRKRQMIVTRR